MDLLNPSSFIGLIRITETWLDPSAHPRSDTVHSDGHSVRSMAGWFRVDSSEGEFAWRRNTLEPF